MENKEETKGFNPRLPNPNIVQEVLDLLNAEIFSVGIGAGSTDAIPKPPVGPRVAGLPAYKLGILGPLPDNLKVFHFKITQIIERLNKVKDEIKDGSGAWDMGGFDSIEYIGNLAKSLISMFMCLVRVHFQYYGKEMFAIQPDWTVVVVPNTTAADFPWPEITELITMCHIEVVA